MTAQTTMIHALLPTAGHRAIRPGMRGMSLLEVMIALMVLAVGIMGALGTMVTVNGFRRDTDERALAYAAAMEYAQKVRLNLGSTILEDWQRPRRATVIPPASSAQPLAQSALLAKGVLSAPTGLDDPQFYLEYYSDVLTTELTRILEEKRIAGSATDPHRLWMQAVGHPSVPIAPDLTLGIGSSAYMPDDHNAFKFLLDTTPPFTVFIRVLVSWRPSHGSGNVRQWVEAVASYRP